MAAQNIDSDYGDWSDLVSIELFSAIADNMNYLIDSCPPGSIVPILIGIPGVPTPDPTIWQEAKGDTIQEQLSDLRGQAAPDLRDRYLKGAASLGQSGQPGGSNTKNLAHSHGGLTGVMQPPSNQHIVSGGSDYWTPNGASHEHTIFPALGTVNFEPRRLHIRYFLKLR